MLETLSAGFKQARSRFAGKATLSEENVQDALADIRQSLLEADVEYSVAKEFLRRVQEKAVGQVVQLKASHAGQRLKVTPGDHFVQICKSELEDIMGPQDDGLPLPKGRVAVVMMVGLQGSGKTTTTGKLCKFLIHKENRRPLLVAADIYRPAAVEQLKILGEKIGVPVFHIPGAKPVEICRQSLNEAARLGCDTVLLDTAGRLAIDEELMQELDHIKAGLKPDHILFVCDSMMGQDAVTTAKSFNDRLNLSGVVMTKLDGDARGGAALSVRYVTGKPIKFLGMGEDLDRLEVFRPEGIASRILGMGDVVGLMEDFQRVASDEQEQDMERLLQGQFNFRDFYSQLSTIQRMGSLKDLVAKLPMQNMLPKDLNVDDNELVKIKAMIDSMTEKERLNPALFNDSRLRRIARGSGRKPQEVADLVKRFKAMRQMMAGFGKGLGGMLGKIPGMGGLGQISQMKQMAQQMMSGGGGMGGMGNLFGGGFPGMGGMQAPARRSEDKEKLKKQRKQAKLARKKNRR